VDDDVDPCSGWERAFEAYLRSDQFKLDTDRDDLFLERANDYGYEK
jgi:hypothetical protein